MDQEQINGYIYDKRQNMLANENIGKLLWKLSFPAGIGMFVMVLYNVVDTIFIGHVVGPLGIAALTIVFPIQMLIMCVGLMIGIGGASLISRLLGARDFDKAERALGNAIHSIVILGILFTLIGLSKSSFWLKLMGASETVLPYAKDYLDIILLGAVFRIFAMGINNLVRAEGNAIVAMISMIIGATLNILLDAFFIIGLAMGVRGAAIATVLSQVITSLYLIHYYLYRNSTLKIRLKNFILKYTIVREIAVIGLSAFVRNASSSFVIIILNRTLVAYSGDLAVAAYGIVHRVMHFVLMPNISIGQGLLPILGFSYGAKRTDRALQVIKLSIIIATIFSVVSCLIIFIFTNPIMRIFTTDNSLIVESVHAARLIFLLFYFVGFQIVGSVVFQAIGKAVPAFLIATSRQVLFLLPLILILPKFFHLNGIWLSFPIADGLSFILTLLLLIPYILELRNVTALEKRAIAQI
jgi:putative MATE family efflux protein